MSKEEIIRPIAHIRTDLPSKFGLPRQSNIVPELTGRIVFEEEYRDINALRGIEEYSHLWLIWQFSENKDRKWSPTVRPPILGGNERVGVFATRSSFRPNSLALSCVRLERVETDPADGPVIIVSGTDMTDNTPLFDIKPYIPMWDSKPDARQGFTGEHERRLLTVKYAFDPGKSFTKEKINALTKLLEQDPRPAYQSDPGRIYGFKFAEKEVRFRVLEDVLTVISIEAENRIQQDNENI